MNAIATANEMQHQSERVILAGALTLFGIMCGMYMYLLSSSVVHVVISKESETKIHQTHSEIAALEAKYMEMQNSISKEVVEQSGYIAAGKKVFIDRSNASLVTRR